MIITTIIGHFLQYGPMQLSGAAMQIEYDYRRITIRVDFSRSMLISLIFAARVGKGKGENLPWWERWACGWKGRGIVPLGRDQLTGPDLLYTIAKNLL